MPGDTMMICAMAIVRGGFAATVMAAAAIAGAASASAADLIRVGKASATTFAFAPIEIGKEKGIWAKYGLEVESIGFGGDARLQQAMVANSIDFSLGSGPGMGFLAKGVPARIEEGWVSPASSEKPEADEEQPETG